MNHTKPSIRHAAALYMAAVLSLISAACVPRAGASADHPQPATPAIPFSDQEIRRILRHAPLPSVQDPTNRFLQSESAARLGHMLFFDTRLSANGQISCATCHDPAKGLADGKRLSEGLFTGRRHTPTIWNAAHNRWFFWDGRADSLWAQALHPIESPIEMGSNRLAIAHLMSNDKALKNLYTETFGDLPDLSNTDRFPLNGRPASGANSAPDDAAWTTMNPEDQDATNRIFANAGKALAAYESKLVSDHSPFDRFVEGLSNGDAEKLTALSPAAQRGLKLFEGRANCRICHMGPNFTDGEFHDTRVPTRDGSPPSDAGRFAGVGEVLRDPFNARGEFSDDPSQSNIEFLVNNPDNWGRFKTPSLRNVARTAPYMHQGQFVSLREVIQFYSTMDGALPAGHHAETILQPLFLSKDEISDLIAFLESLTDETTAVPWLKPPAKTNIRD